LPDSFRRLAHPTPARKESSQQVYQRMMRRLRFIVVVFVLILIAVLVRVVMLQTVQRDDYLEASINQRTRLTTVRAPRGVIFDRTGQELALSVPRMTLFADPREMPDKVAAAASLAIVLQLSPERHESLLSDLQKPGSAFVYLSRGMDKTVAQGILDQKIPGVHGYTEPSRVIEGGVAEAIIGKTDPDGVGASGLELQFNDLLQGRNGQIVRQVDRRGNSIAGAIRTSAEALPGDDLVLTIDKTLQFHTDRALLQRVEQLGAKGGTIILMDAKTGEIYAMSNVRRDSTGAARLASGNFGAVEAYEPGSVAKIFSISAALNEGNVTPDTTFKVPGIMTVDDFVIRDAWPHGLLKMNVREIMTQSSNLGTVMIADTMNNTRKYEYLQAFGFGQGTGLEYPGESKGILRDVKKWQGTEKITVAYGYGFASTALQLVAAVNTVANSGTYVAPKLVRGTVDKNGRLTETKPSDTRSVISPDTAATTTAMLQDVVCSGTGKLAQVKGMTVAGKTGTGYKVQDNGTYVTDAGTRAYFASFVGYYPAENPRVTMLVSIDEPNAQSRDRFGGTAAAPVFALLAPTVMHELGIAPVSGGTGCKKLARTAGQ
jgi:cell division protein FtsI (penicillin-binding protein 3)